jgi:hypothetical protein
VIKIWKLQNDLAAGWASVSFCAYERPPCRWHAQLDPSQEVWLRRVRKRFRVNLGSLLTGNAFVRSHLA